MNKEYYCTKCDEYVDTKILTKCETLEVKDLKITIKNIKVRVCANCGEELNDEELDNYSLNLFYEEYRKQKNLLTVSQIKEIRNKYSLSQKSFALLLGFGEKTITRYENGSIQDVAHDLLIRSVNDINTFVKIWNIRKSLLTKQERKRTEFVLNELERENINISYKETYYDVNKIIYSSKREGTYKWELSAK